MSVDRLRWVVAYWLFRAVILLGRLLPTRLCYALAAPIADLCYLGFRGQRRHLVANLTRVLGDEVAARAAARRAFRQYSKYVIDFFQLAALSSEELKRRIAFQDWDQLTGVLENGRGTILATLHLGQWEMGGAALAAYGYPVNVVAQTFDYGPMNDLVQSLRRDLGMRIIAAGQAKLAVFRALRRNEVLGMLVDVVDPGEGVPVQFFGAQAEMSRAPAQIALRTGARLVAAVVCRDERDPRRLTPVLDCGLEVEATGDEVADVAALTQALATALERQVRDHADQWFAFHPVWSSAPPAGPEVGGERWKQWALAAAFHLVRRLPRSAAYGIGHVVGDAAYYLRAGVRRDVEDNMRHVLGPGAPSGRVRRAAREAFRNVCRYYADLILLPRIRPEALLRDSVTVVGLERLKAAMAGGRGAVLATAHFGNPEMASQVAKPLDIDLLVLAEPLNPPAFSHLMTRLRRPNDIKYEDVGFGAISHALRHLRSGGCVAIACDRDIQGTGVLLPFFGQETALPLGAVQLAARTDAALVPAYCKRRIGGFDLVFEEELKLVKTAAPKADAMVNARALLGRVEPWISAEPGQWMVLERIWKDAGKRPRRHGKPLPGARI